jgi:hypothetical protein
VILIYYMYCLEILYSDLSMSFFEEGFFVQICERSLTGKQNGPTMPPVQSFVRAEMFPSGYLIRPCEGGGCIIHIVDHVEYEVAFHFSISSTLTYGSYLDRICEPK